jgi:nucleoside-diphosphate-sugar epimerase
MKLLVIGGTGFLSGTLVRVAQATGHHVTIITRGTRPAPAGVTALVADRENPAAFTAAVNAHPGEWDLVVDCIAYEPADASQVITHFRHRAGHLVFISTDFVITSEGRTFPQDADTAPRRTDDSYGGKKRRGEDAYLALRAVWNHWTILRPAHIYGPGSLLGCLPEHGRQADLVERIRRGDTLNLVGGGHFLQQPVLARDLAATILACATTPAARGQIYMVPGPDTIESRRFYELIGELLGLPVRIAELPLDPYRAAHPEKDPFLCHRIYDAEKLRRDGLPVPATPLTTGLREHLQSLNHLPADLPA